MLPVILVFLLAGLFLALSVAHFLEKGALLNNAWLYASREERSAMDKKPHYRQSAVVFLLLAAVFALNGVGMVTKNDLFTIIAMAVVIAAVVYAVVSFIRLVRSQGRETE